MGELVESPSAHVVDLSTTQVEYVRPATGTERKLAELLAEIIGTESLSVHSNFFDDLGADSLLMAQFCARVRKRPDLPTVSMKDVYRHPTIGGLATALGEPVTAPADLGTETALAEILAEIVGTEHVSVDSNFFDDLGADSLLMARFCARVRKRPDLPTVSIQDVYAHPTLRSLATTLTKPVQAPGDPGTEKVLADVLAEIVGVEHVPADSNFFDDLGADSLLMARFCARVRKRPDLPTVSIQDVYAHPTLRSLAATLAAPEPAAAELPTTALPEVAARANRFEYILCGILQLLVYVGYAFLVAVVLEQGYDWVSEASSLSHVYLRSLVFGAAIFIGLSLLPIVAKWLLVGRWKPRQIRIWSLSYVRFWTVKMLVRVSPMIMFVGSPLYLLYLRALGAHIGRRVLILSRDVPVCTDLLTIGDDTVIRKDSFFSCYRGRAGLIETGRVTLGKNVYVGEATVLDIGTAMGDDTQLGNSSSLHTGQSVPDGERWHGSPGRRTEVNYQTIEQRARVGALRKFVSTVLQLLSLLLVRLPVTIGGVALVLVAIPRLAVFLGANALDLTDWEFYLYALAASFIIFFGLVLAGFLIVTTVPRLLGLFIKPDKVYPLHGFHHSLHRAITRLTNLRFFTYLFGDSSYIVNYLNRLGGDVSRKEQTGSNFGLEVKHETPYMFSVGPAAMVADGLSVINADFTSTSFRVSRATIGAHTFLGNNVSYPAQSRLGENCLVASKAMVPIDGPVRENVGLLGSPSFEIPRSVHRDTRFDNLRRGRTLRRRLAAKNKHNLRTMGLYLLARWGYFFGVVVLFLAADELYHTYGAWVDLPADILLMLSVLYFVLVERAVTGFRKLQPRYCSIYDPHFWWHERFWKVPAMGYFLRAFDGTPFKSMIWRLLGVRVGKRLFDDGCGLPERSLVTIGDDVTLNVHSKIQCHSQEDGTFKSDRITIGSGSTLGVGAFVMYGATLGDGSELEPDSYLMKGEDVSPHSRWGGNPAIELQEGFAQAA
ncbi:Pls/PosA family non-ribosomal peptide synthetase [Pseudonocardia sp. CA-142604]|uniref:Pls/PosA family non-ribosomal peptide synthetase n=1 Tax=Pseudonocardia sp. CA-142604 TaxID=3240024 RepID=UPI003D9226FB